MYISNIRSKLNSGAVRRYFSSIKTFKSTTVNESGKEVTSIPSQGNLEIKLPLEAFVGSISACEVHAILMIAKAQKVTIDKIEIDVKADFDMDVLMGKKEGRNTYTGLELEARVWSKDDKAKVQAVVEKGENVCPLLNTIRLANIPVKQTIKLL